MQLDAHIASQYVVSCQQLIDQILVVRWFSFQKKCVQQKKGICSTILTVSCSCSSFTACPIDMDPYLLPYKHVSMPIGHSVKTLFRTSYEESPFFIFVLNLLPPRGILDHGNTPDHHWKWKTEKFLALCFDKTRYWFQDEAGTFLVILMPAAQMIVWVDANHELP